MPYLSGACLGQVGNDEDFLRSSEGADDFADLERQLLLERCVIVVREFTAEQRGNEMQVCLTAYA